MLHEDIKNKLKNFVELNSVPNIIFYGSNGSGKRTLLKEFLEMIYKNNKKIINEYVFIVDCARGKGIKFIREELKFFTKTNLEINNNTPFKSVVLLNADKLTNDAQSALRRLIEIYSYNTRFFIIVQDKFKMLKPILSRLSEIYIPEPIINNKIYNLYEFHKEEKFDINKENVNRDKKLKTLIKKYIENSNNNNKYLKIKELTEDCYENGYSSLDILRYLDNLDNLDNKDSLILFFNKIKKEYRCEKMLMLLMFYMIFIRFDYNVEYICFM